MPRMPFSINAFRRDRGSLPQLPVVNMFAEPAPTEETGVALQSRPGLVDVRTYGLSPIECLFRKDGVLGGTLFATDGLSLYSASVIGAVNGSGPFSMDGYASSVFVAGGADLWEYNGTTLTKVTFPDGAHVIKVLVAASRVITLRSDTQKFYWSNVLSDTIGGLSFASAESQPDQLRDALFIDDILILFGAETVEFWPSTTDAELPFQPLEGRVLERGIRATGCVSRFNSTFAWVTNTNQVCVTDTETVISDAGLEALLEASETASLWSFTLEGTEFLALRMDAATWVYSARSGNWAEFKTEGQENWIAQCFGGGVFGSAIDGRTFAWGEGHTDHGGTLERRFRAGVAINAGVLTIDNIILRGNPGHTSFLVGDYVSPAVEMRRSLDGGMTWGKWRRITLGEQGKYRQRLQWTGCGMAGHPGFLAEFRITDPVDFRASGVVYNETIGAF